MPAADVDNERRVVEATAREEGKPEAALPKIIEGRVTGFYKTVALLDQPSVQDNKKSVGERAQGRRRDREAVRPFRGRPGVRQTATSSSRPTQPAAVPKEAASRE